MFNTILILSLFVLFSSLHFANAAQCRRETKQIIKSQQTEWQWTNDLNSNDWKTNKGL
jgi:hypothetical protein